MMFSGIFVSPFLYDKQVTFAWVNECLLSDTCYAAREAGLAFLVDVFLHIRVWRTVLCVNNLLLNSFLPLFFICLLSGLASDHLAEIYAPIMKQLLIITLRTCSVEEGNF